VFEIHHHKINFLQVEQKPVKELSAELNTRCFVAMFEDVPSVLEGLVPRG
jgi:hypothetical protein